jgi:hypothetical protein
MEQKRYKPKRGEVCVVASIPSCNFCKDGTPGPYDFATVMGPWANGCERHWKQYRANPKLGVGSGQLWITEDQVAREEQAARR